MTNLLLLSNVWTYFLYTVTTTSQFRFVCGQAERKTKKEQLRQHGEERNGSGKECGQEKVNRVQSVSCMLGIFRTPFAFYDVLLGDLSERGGRLTLFIFPEGAVGNVHFVVRVQSDRDVANSVQVVFDQRGNTIGIFIGASNYEEIAFIRNKFF